ncbi:hypothetical protein BKI52_33610 [marine bacterium AO1-C]|nr:hypothetical protein BKI52_33610 [marine bacterium AO1-C]
MKYIFTLIITLIIVEQIPAQQVVGQLSELKSSIQNYVEKHNFNGTIMIQQKGKTIYQKSYGLANREFKVPNRIDTKYRIASITKLFTAVLIYQLVEKQRIDLDKTIHHYLPNYRGEGAKKVTIHQLLTSTSGIADLEKDGDTVYEKRLNSDQVLQKYASGKLEADPGTKFNYNNADYIILGKILENIYAQPFAELLKQRILVPLKMSQSGVFNYGVVDNLATCYWWNEKTKQLERDVPYFVENYQASGAMYSTANDLLAFATALYQEKKLIGSKMLKKLLEAKNDVKDKDNYASGLWSYGYRVNKNLVHHGAARPGNIWGTETMLLRLLEKQTTIVVLSNSMGTSSMWGFLNKMIPKLYGK